MKALEDPNLTSDQRQLLNEIQGVRYVVINQQHGGFGLSQAGIQRYLEILGQEYWTSESERFSNLVGPTYWLVPPEQQMTAPDAETWYSMSMAQRQQHNQEWERATFCHRDIARDDPVLVRLVRELGIKANGPYASLKIVEIPADVDWIIEEYDGLEWVAEKHRTWD